jgi:hypothetical protein
MGNLIALPLNGKALMNFNSAFLNPEHMLPYNNQIEAIKSFRKLTSNDFKSIYEKIFNEKVEDFLKSSFDATSRSVLEIQINGQIYIKRLQLNRKLIEFIRENLNFLNSDFLIKKNLGKSTFDTEKYFRLIEETPDGVILPRGFAANLIIFCKKEDLPFKIIDDRRKLDPIDFDSEIELRPEQETAIEKTLDKDFGVIVSPPGSGKTIIGLELIAQKRQPALIIVHRKQLFDQWLDRIQSFLKIPKKNIGQIGSQKFKVGKEITVAMIQSLSRNEKVDEISGNFGTIIVDECHHISAVSFEQVVRQSKAKYLTGLSATVVRKDGHHPIFLCSVGRSVIVSMIAGKLSGDPLITRLLSIRRTSACPRICRT